jgi:hypothetical protein
MGDVTFPGIVTATAAAAIVGFNATPYPVEAKAYVVEQPGPTSWQLTDLTVEPSISEFPNQIAAVFASLSEGQEPLGSDFETIWDANLDKLYEF